MICPYREMSQLHSLPCIREERGSWIYCSFCGQKMRPEMPFERGGSLIEFLVTAIILVFFANALGNSLNPPKPLDTFERTNSGPVD